MLLLVAFFLLFGARRRRQRSGGWDWHSTALRSLLLQSAQVTGKEALEKRHEHLAGGSEVALGAGDDARLAADSRHVEFCELEVDNAVAVEMGHDSLERFLVGSEDGQLSREIWSKERVHYCKHLEIALGGKANDGARIRAVALEQLTDGH